MIYEGHHVTSPDFLSNFHTWVLEWESKEIRWYVDGTLRYATRKHIPRRRMRRMLSAAVGGDWPGNPDETTVFPQFHHIDSVRVYAMRDGNARRERVD